MRTPLAARAIACSAPRSNMQKTLILQDVTHAPRPSGQRSTGSRLEYPRNPSSFRHRSARQAYPRRLNIVFTASPSLPPWGLALARPLLLRRCPLPPLLTPPDRVRTRLLLGPRPPLEQQLVPRAAAVAAAAATAALLARPPPPAPAPLQQQGWHPTTQARSSFASWRRLHLAPPAAPAAAAAWARRRRRTCPTAAASCCLTPQAACSLPAVRCVCWQVWTVVAVGTCCCRVVQQESSTVQGKPAVTS
mgnify:CR=1 FL=1